jgi:MFS-type transporter involved in bile tolerance (Atg22 family)
MLKLSILIGLWLAITYLVSINSQHIGSAFYVYALSVAVLLIAILVQIVGKPRDT